MILSYFCPTKFFIMWVFLAILSAAILGIYDILKKMALTGNRVIPVLFLGSLFGALLFVPLIILSAFVPGFEKSWLYIPPQNLQAHLFFFSKAALVGSSWLFAYFAIKHLPVTTVSTIRSSAPVWTLLGAIVLFGEKLNTAQWLGIISAIAFYYLFSLSGKKEKPVYKQNRWLIFAIIATLLGSVSSLYDKFLVAEFDRLALQAWFSVYMPLFLLPFLLLEKSFLGKSENKFKWRPVIPLIGFSLVLADFAYFMALDQEGSLISLISAIRRTSVIFTFLLAGMVLKEPGLGKKIPALAGILASVALIIYGTHGA